MERLNVGQMPVHAKIIHPVVDIRPGKPIVRQVELVTPVERGIPYEVGVIRMAFAHPDKSDRIDHNHQAEHPDQHPAAPDKVGPIPAQHQIKPHQPEQGDCGSRGEPLRVFGKAELDRLIRLDGRRQAKNRGDQRSIEHRDIEPEPQVNRPVLKGAGGHSRHQQKRHVIPPRVVRVVE